MTWLGVQNNKSDGISYVANHRLVPRMFNHLDDIVARLVSVGMASKID